jgi:hypothetical protein
MADAPTTYAGLPTRCVIVRVIHNLMRLGGKRGVKGTGGGGWYKAYEWVWE